MEHDPDARRQLLLTFRILRCAIVGASLVMAGALIMEAIRVDIRGSISAYFYSPARSIFVGGLMAIGVCLIALQARTVPEETFLNLAGLLAFVVALVPIQPDACQLTMPNGPVSFDPQYPMPSWLTTMLKQVSAGNCRLDKAAGGPSDGLPSWVVTGIRNNVFSVIVVGALALGLILWLRSSSTRRDSTDRSVRAGWIALVFYGVFLLVGVALYATFDGNRSTSHYYAAVSMFVMFGAVVVISGWFRKEVPRAMQIQYRAIAILMALVIPLGAVASVFWLEAAEIALFTWFWTAQTVQIWNPYGKGAKAILPANLDVAM
ncbi:MAG: hypothetical protein SGI92_31935 [Bryobacteraceae bacterium]|nr:hypothetical protein [Bryobacteraceae bacterium]